MARVFTVKSSRESKRPKVCGRCGKPIEPPEGYFWAAPGYHAPKKYRHLSHPFKRSELTTSAVSVVYAAQEDFEAQANKGFESIEDIQAAYDAVKETLEDFLSERESALDAWENGNSMLEELRDAAQEAYDEIEGWNPEDEYFDGDEELLSADEPEDHDSDEWSEWNVNRDDYSEFINRVANEAEDHVSGITL